MYVHMTNFYAFYLFIFQRSCLGENLAKEEVFLFLANILKRFSLSLDPSQPQPTFEPQKGFMLHPQDYRLVLKDRLT